MYFFLFYFALFHVFHSRYLKFFTRSIVSSELSAIDNPFVSGTAKLFNFHILNLRLKIFLNLSNSFKRKNDDLKLDLVGNYKDLSSMSLFTQVTYVCVKILRHILNIFHFSYSYYQKREK